jgi:hypothetical protein
MRRSLFHVQYSALPCDWPKRRKMQTRKNRGLVLNTLFSRWKNRKEEWWGHSVNGNQPTKELTKVVRKHKSTSLGLISHCCVNRISVISNRHYNYNWDCAYSNDFPSSVSGVFILSTLVWVSSVSIVLQTGRPRNQGSIPGRAGCLCIFFRPDCLWGRPILQWVRTRETYCEGKVAGVWSWLLTFISSAEVQNTWNNTPFHPAIFMEWSWINPLPTNVVYIRSSL